MSPCTLAVSAFASRPLTAIAMALAVLGLVGTASAQCPSAPTGVTVRRLGCSSEVSLTLSGPTVGVEIRRSAAGDLSGNIAASTVVGAIPTSLGDTGVRTFRDMTAELNSSYVYWAVAKGSPVFCNQRFESVPVLLGLPAATDIGLVVSRSCGQVSLQWVNYVEVSPENRYDYTIEVLRENADNPADTQVLMSTPSALVGLTRDSPGGRFTFVVRYTLPCGVVAIRSPVVVVDAPPVVTAARDFVSVVSGQSSSGQPAPSAVLPSGIAAASSNVAWTWTRDGVVITDGLLGGRASVNPITGALTILQPRIGDAGEYRVTASGACGSGSAAVGLIVQRRFAADVNDSGEVSLQDLFDFLSAFFGGF